MKKTIITGALAVAFIAAGGTGIYMASAKEEPINVEGFMNSGMLMKSSAEGTVGNWNKIHSEQGKSWNGMMESGSLEDMEKFMEEQNINFGQMKPYMQNMHPEMNVRELEEMYKGMHGTGGSANSQNFRGMDGSHF